MKRRGIVLDVEDPRNFGRIRVELVGYDTKGNTTPWCWPCSPFAGPGYGFYCLPAPGDEVYVERTDEGDWVWVGFCWTERNAKPADGTKDVRLFRTPVGHQMKFDENGDVEIVHTNGNIIAMRSNGDVEIEATSNLNIQVAKEANIICGGKAIVKATIIELNGVSGKVVTTSHICAYTGSPHVLGSAIVKAGG